MSKKTPEIRFKGFTDDWEQRKFNELIHRKSKKSDSSNLPKIEFEDITAGEGRLNKDISKKFDNRKGILFYPENILYGKLRPYLKNWIFSDFKGIALGDFWIFEARNSNPLFIYSLIQSNRYQKVANDTSGTKMPRSDWNKISKTNFSIPSKEEQLKIGIFFKQLDETIALHQAAIQRQQDLKKGLLQKIFPAKDEKIPAVRFISFTEEWQQRKLKGILKERNEQITESSEYPLMSFVQGVGVIPKGERYDRSFLVKNDSKKYKKTELGDFIYSSNNLDTGSIGFNKMGKAVISPVYSIFFSETQLESKFIGVMSLKKDFLNKLIRFRQGVVYGQWRIHEKDFLNINLNNPSKIEQQKIVEFFEKFDDILVVHQQAIDKLKKLKQSLLQKMFI